MAASGDYSHFLADSSRGPGDVLGAALQELGRLLGDVDALAHPAKYLCAAELERDLVGVDNDGNGDWLAG